MENLTTREKEVLHLIAYEYTTKEIAKELYISAHTVLTHRKHLLAKMAVKNAAGMIRKGFERGLLQVAIMIIVSTTILTASTPYPIDMSSTTSIIYVNTKNSFTQDGTSWNTAYATLQDALSDAKQTASLRNPKEIWVAQGTYFPDEGVGITDDARDSSFYLINNVAILGGFVGTENCSYERDWVQNATILSGDIDQDGTHALNTYNVFYNNQSSANPINATAVLDGFIIEQGKAEVSSPLGGAMYSFYSFAEINNCWFRNNQGVIGGAVYQERNGSTFTNCIFTDNDAIANLGDALYFNQNADSTRILNCTIYNNDLDNGKAITINNSRITIINSIIWKSATSFSDGGETHLVENCIMQGGYAPGINIIDADPQLLDTVNLDYSLRANSPAIDAGQAVDFDYDYIGQHRSLLDTVDIGAIEFLKQVIYVDFFTLASQLGTSWDYPYKYLQDALTEAGQINEHQIEVWVKEGGYSPDEGAGYTDDDRNAYFPLLRNVDILGGFVGTETDVSQRDPFNHKALLTGRLNPDNDSASYHIFKYDNISYIPQSNEYSVLDGFVISNGRADGLSSTDDDKGGAIYIKSRGGFKFQNCEFVNNFGENGGAIYKSSINPIDSLKISNVVFTNNEGRSGGAIFINGGTTLLDSCDLSFNHTTSSGGAINHQFGQLNASNSDFFRNTTTSIFTNGGAIRLAGEFEINNCSFTNNGTDTVSMRGGALSFFNKSGIIKNSKFISNVSKGDGGAIYSVGGDVLIEGCYFEKNRNGISSVGGAIFLSNVNTNRVNNCVFYDNKASYHGGAIYNSFDSNASISNSTFYKNSSSFVGGALYNLPDDSLSITNCIFWDNNFPSDVEISGSTFHQLTNCIIEGGLNQGMSTLVGTEILDIYPAFVDTLEANLDLSLMSCSPAIDAGDNIYVSSGVDYDQNPRFHNATGLNFPMVDLGAYEFQGGFDPGCSDCPQHLVLTGDIHSGVYEASSSVICNGTIVDGSSVIFSAPDSVVMQPYFDAGINTDLTVLQDSCEN